MSAENTTATVAVNKPKPGVRFLARTFDLSLFSVLLLCSWYGYNGFDSPDILASRNNQYAFGFATSLVWCFIEAIFISKFGATFGKWILGIQITSEDGGKINYTRALKRSFGVWARGWGLGISPIGIITSIISYRKLNREGTTPWDSNGHLKVIHKKLGILNKIMIILFYVLPFILYLVTIALIIQQVN